MIMGQSGEWVMEFNIATGIAQKKASRRKKITHLIFSLSIQVEQRRNSSRASSYRGR